MASLLKDLAYGVRMLRRSPGFSAAAVLTLALGIGANTAIFSVVDTVLLRPLPFGDAAALEMIWNQYDSSGPGRGAISPPEFADLIEQAGEYDGIVALRDWEPNLTGDGEPERIHAFLVSPGFFEVLGIRLALGRAFFAAEGAQGADRVAVISDDLWRTRFGADRTVVGRTIRLDDRPCTVVGIAPPGFRFPDVPSLQFAAPAQVWSPLSWEALRTQSRGNQILRVVARRRAGVTPEDAQAGLDRVAAGFAREFPDRYGPSIGWRLVAVPLERQILGDVRPALLLFTAAAALVLLIACANVAGLLLARGAARERELAIRASLGAGRAQLVRQLFLESLVLAAAGGIAGVLFAGWGVDAISRLAPRDVPRIDVVALNPRALVFGLGITLATAVAFGLIPALRQSAVDLGAGLRAGGARTGISGRQPLRRSLVAAEVALALMVLVGAGLIARTFLRLQDVDLGFRPADIQTFEISLPGSRYRDPVQSAAFYQELLGRLRSLPGVQAAGAADPLPLGGQRWSGSYEIEGRPVSPGEPYPHAEYAAVTPGYFRAMGIPLRDGREFTDRDAKGVPQVVIVDESLAARDWPGEDAIGKRLDVGGEPNALSEVVGVVAHVRSAGPPHEGEPQIYLPFLQHRRNAMGLAVRGSAAPPSPADIRAVVRSIDTELPAAQFRTMQGLVTTALARPYFNVVVLVSFAIVALALAAGGVYALTAFLVAQRSHEFGVRIALGARPADVLRLAVRQGTLPVVVGIAVGLVGAAAGTRILSSLLYGVGPGDPATLVAAPLALAAVGLLACYLPARRATKVDPMAALRSE